jgi:hypothetical protein
LRLEIRAARSERKRARGIASEKKREVHIDMSCLARKQGNAQGDGAAGGGRDAGRGAGC